MKKAIVNSTIHTGEEILKDSVIVVENGSITAIQKEMPSGVERIDLQGDHLSAGFIDIQVNGGEERYFSQYPDEESIRDIHLTGLKYGTTHTLPCLISSPKEKILAAIEAVGNYKARYGNGVPGMHLEGPFINPVKRGAHLPQRVRKPGDGELEEIIRYGKDIIKVITIAPECLTEQQVDMLLDSGIVVSAGHSDMGYLQAQYFFSKGIKLVTHLFNAMNQLGHREPGLVGAALDNEHVYTPAILDGAHCDYAAARIAYAVKKDRFFLISDACFLGGKRRSFTWEGFDVELKDGFYRNPEGRLSGAAITMEDAVRNAVRHMGVPVEEAIRMATVRAAKAINMDTEIGRIKPGFPATFVRFDEGLLRFEALDLK